MRRPEPAAEHRAGLPPVAGAVLDAFAEGGLPADPDVRHRLAAGTASGRPWSTAATGPDGAAGNAAG